MRLGLWIVFLCSGLSAWGSNWDGAWKDPEDGTRSLTVASDKITIQTAEEFINGDYPVGEEKIVSASDSGSEDFLGGTSHYCVAHTRLAVRTENYIILIQTLRTSPTKTFGVGCYLSHSLEGYSQPYAYSRVIVTRGTDDRLYSMSTVLDSAIDLPKLSVEQLKSPDVFVQYPTAWDYIQKEIKQNYSHVQLHMDVYSKN